MAMLNKRKIIFCLVGEEMSKIQAQQANNGKPKKSISMVVYNRDE